MTNYDYIKFLNKKLYLAESMLLEYLLKNKDNKEIKDIYDAVIASPKQVDKIINDRREYEG